MPGGDAVNISVNMAASATLVQFRLVLFAGWLQHEQAVATVRDTPRASLIGRLERARQGESAFLKAIRRVRRQGYAISVGRAVPGAFGAAAAMVDSNGKLAAVLVAARQRLFSVADAVLDADSCVFQSKTSSDSTAIRAVIPV